MEKKINVAELLKDAPKGTKLWSSTFGDVELLRVRYALANAEESHKHDCTEDFSIECEFHAKDYSMSRKFGTDPFGRLYRYDECPCTLFPSKDNRDWSTFKLPTFHKQFEPFQRIIYPMYNGSDSPRKYKADIYSHWDDDLKRHVTVAECKLADSGILPYEGNEDKLGKEAE